MPELPDVETLRAYMDTTALHHRIEHVSIRDARVVQRLSADTLRKRLKGKAFESSHRHGKFLFVRLGHDGWMVFHFGMTGSLRYFKEPLEDPEHDRLRLDFDNGYHLAFDCRRMLGGVDYTEDAEAFVRDRQLGPDALQLDEEEFVELLAERSGSIKSALMDQHLIAGIGNVYSDEILFQANVHPKTYVEDLTTTEVARLYARMHSVLEEAIEAQADPERMPQGWLIPHRRAGAHCPRCDTPLKRIQIAQRSAWFCPNCQRAGD